MRAFMPGEVFRSLAGSQQVAEESHVGEDPFSHVGGESEEGEDLFCPTLASEASGSPVVAQEPSVASTTCPVSPDEGAVEQGVQFAVVAASACSFVDGSCCPRVCGSVFRTHAFCLCSRTIRSQFAMIAVAVSEISLPVALKAD